jgi:hypothetical protein
MQCAFCNSEGQPLGDIAVCPQDAFYSHIIWGSRPLPANHGNTVISWEPSAIQGQEIVLAKGNWSTARLIAQLDAIRIQYSASGTDILGHEYHRQGKPQPHRFS